MSARNCAWVAVCGVAVALTAGPVAAQPPQQAKPDLLGGHNLKVRKGKDTDWDKAQKVGVEVFKDPTAKAVVAINAAGNIAVAAADDAASTKKPEWVSALSFSVRGAGEQQFTAGSTLFGVEAYKGVLNGHLLLVSERGGMTFFKTDSSVKDKDPQFQFGLSLKVRKPDQEKFGPESKAHGVEAYKDNNTGGLVYITDGGLLATSAAVPEKAPTQTEIKKPKALYALILRVRKADEKDFTDATQKVEVEVFREEHTNSLIYISETGSIAVVPAGEVKKNEKPVWSHAMVLKARPGGEDDFGKAKKFGIEVFTDEHTGATVFITETGAIGVLPKK